MTHRVPKSIADAVGNFGALVTAHVAELAQWAVHREAVQKGEAQWYPPPQAIQDVQMSVRAEPVDGGARVAFVEDYEIFDDSPPVEVVLRAKKDQLLASVSVAENAAVIAVIAPGKRRLLDLQYFDAVQKKDDARTDEDRETIKRRNEVVAKIASIARFGAQVSSDVEDLTIDNIDQWTLPEFGL